MTALDADDSESRDRGRALASRDAVTSITSRPYGNYSRHGLHLTIARNCLTWNVALLRANCFPSNPSVRPFARPPVPLPPPRPRPSPLWCTAGHGRGDANVHWCDEMCLSVRRNCVSRDLSSDGTTA